MDARTPEKRAVAARDADATKRRILQAARTEFARFGLGGARIERIAEAARTNKRMLYYYFGNKEGLFLAALEATYEDIRAAERKLDLESLAPLKAIERLVRFSWDYLVEHPEFRLMVASENLHLAKHLKRSKQIQAVNSPAIATIAKILRRGARDGTIRPGIDPFQLHISIAALGYFYLSNAYTLSVTFGRDMLAKTEMKQRVEHVVELVLAGLRP